MPYKSCEIESIIPHIQELFRISSELGQTFSGRKFTLDGHLVGSIGEVLAAYTYGLQLLPSSAKQHDAIAPDGRRVQIKATQGARHVALRSAPDYLIVLLINSSTGDYCELYNGPGLTVWEACGEMSSNGTRPISLPKLRRMAEFVNDAEKIKRIDVDESYRNR